MYREVLIFRWCWCIFITLSLTKQIKSICTVYGHLVWFCVFKTELLPEFISIQNQECTKVILTVNSMDSRVNIALSPSRIMQSIQQRITMAVISIPLPLKTNCWLKINSIVISLMTSSKQGPPYTAETFANFWLIDITFILEKLSLYDGCITRTIIAEAQAKWSEEIQFVRNKSMKEVII